MRHIGDQSAAGGLKLFAVERQDVDAIDAHPTGRNAQAFARQPEKSYADGALAGSGLAHQAQDPAGSHPEGYVFDDGGAAPFGDDSQPFHDETVFGGLFALTGRCGHVG